MNGAASSPPPTDRRFARNIRADVKVWFKQPETSNISKTLWSWLLVTLGADVIVAVALAVGELSVAVTVYGTLGAGILLAIGIANFWAFHSVHRATPSWARDAAIAQLVMVFLALYIIVSVGFNSPQQSRLQWHMRTWLVLAIAVLVVVLAAVWILRLGAYTAGEWSKATKAAATITALLPIAGSLQFWLQNYYIPETSAPQVDVSVDLSPQGRSCPDQPSPPCNAATGSIFHLSAKVTVHNRSAIRVDVAGALMRITAYRRQAPSAPNPSAPPQPIASAPPAPEASQVCFKYQDPPYQDDPTQNLKPCLEGDLDLSGVNSDSDFRVDPTPATNAQLLYAGLFMNEDSFLTPGETDTFQREVDLDSKAFRLARFSVSAIFLPERIIRDTRSCLGKDAGTTASALTDPRTFAREVSIAQTDSDERNVPALGPHALQHYLCVQYEIAPRNVIESLTGDHLVVQTVMTLNDPQEPGNEYPQISAYWRTDEGRGDVSAKFTLASPITSQDVYAEYTPGEKIASDSKE
jgi:hypothetical protein